MIQNPGREFVDGLEFYMFCLTGTVHQDSFGVIDQIFSAYALVVGLAPYRTGTVFSAYSPCVEKSKNSQEKISPPPMPCEFEGQYC